MTSLSLRGLCIRWQTGGSTPALAEFIQTAATRSLLNTAKLMEESLLLLRLRELESLERLVEKRGRIDLHAGEGASPIVWRCKSPTG